MTPFNAQFYHWRTDPKARGWSLPRKNAIRPMWTALHYDAAIKKKRGSQAPLEGGGWTRDKNATGNTQKKWKKSFLCDLGGLGVLKCQKHAFFAWVGTSSFQKYVSHFLRKISNNKTIDEKIGPGENVSQNVEFNKPKLFPSRGRKITRKKNTQKKFKNPCLRSPKQHHSWYSTATELRSSDGYYCISQKQTNESRNNRVVE